MKSLTFLICLIPLFAQAGVILNGGLSGITELKSEAENSAGKSLFDGDGTLGYNLGAELPVLNNFLSFNLNFLYGRMEGKSQYFERATNLQISDQKSYLSNTESMVGIKIRPVNFKYLKFFIGGGGILGNKKLRHDKDDYVERFGTLPSSFKEIEKKKSWGHYLEAGTEIGLSKNGGLRLGAQLLNQSTERFTTLNKKSINGSYAVYSLTYIHYFEKLLPRSK